MTGFSIHTKNNNNRTSALRFRVYCLFLIASQFRCDEEKGLRRWRWNYYPRAAKTEGFSRKWIAFFGFVHRCTDSAILMRHSFNLLRHIPPNFAKTAYYYIWHHSFRVQTCFNRNRIEKTINSLVASDFGLNLNCRASNSHGHKFIVFPFFLCTVSDCTIKKLTSFLCCYFFTWLFFFISNAEWKFIRQVIALLKICFPEMLTPQQSNGDNRTKKQWQKDSQADT